VASSEHQASDPQPVGYLTGRVGEIIDSRYRIIGLLGRGGMGSVYRAEHVHLRRVVALKLLHPDAVGSAEVARRFEREALATGIIDHPNIVTASDFGRLPDGSLYLAMELLAGTSLGDILADQPRLEPGRALRIVRHVLRGLLYAHAAGIVHRDVKPDNVVVVAQPDDPDFAKILDFGIAKFLDDAAQHADSAGLTQIGTTIGTPIYMAPEQALGRPVDGRADLYAVTVMLFELLTGRTPFVADDMLELLSLHVGGAAPSLREVAPDLDVPDSLEELVVRGLAKRPADRIATAEEYLAAIDAVLAELEAGPGRPRPALSLTSAGPLGRAWGHPRLLRARRWLDRHRTAALAGGGALILMVVIAIAATWGSSPSGPGAPASGGDAPAPVRVPDDKLAAARALLDRGEARGVIELLDPAPPPSAKPEKGAAPPPRRVSSPDAELLLGHAYAARGDNAKALAAYASAVRQRPAVADDRLRANLTVLLDDAGAQAEAFALLEALVSAGDPDSRTRLLTTATADPDLSARRTARAAVARLHLDGSIDWLEAYSADLRDGKTCPQRREAVGRLRALADPRAIPALEKARNRPYKGGLFNLQTKNANACLKKAAEEALQSLQHPR
jgi:eukaryotic-like serine/threonine-protein kinase